jgi:hypothetical protein
MGCLEAVTLLLKNEAKLECVRSDGTTTSAGETAQQHEQVYLALDRF